MKLNTTEIQRRISLTGLTNREFCRQHGIGENSLQAWLTDCHYPNIDSRLKLAKALRCSIEDIEIDDNQQVMFGDADTAVKAFCAAVEKEMVSRTKLTEITCDNKDCPFRATHGFHCNAKQLFIENGKCSMIKYKKMMEMEQ